MLAYDWGMDQDKNNNAPVVAGENPGAHFRNRRVIIFVIVGVVLAVALGVAAWLWSMSSVKQTASQTNTTSNSSVQQQTAQTEQKTQLKTVDMTQLPLGDGKVTTTTPQRGYVMRCGNEPNGGGAQNAGSWIHGSTWDATQKVSVDGSVPWPTASANFQEAGSVRKITGNGLPVGSNTGVFPIKAGTTAYQYDRNPNSIRAQSVSYNVPANPGVAATPHCLTGGPIGFMLNGVALFDGLDADKRDAAAHEVQDTCHGHPEKTGQYHYHNLSDCVPHAEENNQLIGYALDGFGIFSSKDAQGNEYTDADLDECHGLTGQITWDGKTVNMYHYVMTREFPYSLGCFKGTPVTTPPAGRR